MVSTRARKDSAYQGQRDELDSFDGKLVELLRIGLAGDASGMRQLLDRLVRQAPPQERKALRDALALAAAQTDTPFVPFRAAEGPPDAWASYEGPRRVEDVVRPMPPAASRAGQVGLSAGDALPAGLSFTAVPDMPPPVLEAVAAKELAVVVHEQRMATRLAAAGLHPTHKLLLTGPPGTGKTHTARWLAFTLERPLITLDLPQLVAHELGRSARNLQAALNAAARHEAVLFVDELDAIGKARAEAGDVGEMTRLVNVLLLELDRWPHERLLVAATNHETLLDPALLRRFERRLELRRPGPEVRRQLLRCFLPDAAHGGPDDELLEVAASLTSGCTGSELRDACADARRSAVLEGGELGLHLLEAVLRRGPELSVGDRDKTVHLLSKLGLAQRAIAPLVGVSHPTVGAILKRLR